MAYYSDVRICTSKRGIREIKEALKKANSNLWDVCDELKEFIGYDNKKYVVFGWNLIKWYENYTEIKEIRNAFWKMDELEIPFKFIRIGEESDDIEEYSVLNGNYNVNCINICNEIEVSCVN